jgi:hypothetical protein
MSPTIACQQKRYDADMATCGGAVQGIYPDALLIGAPTAAARFVAGEISAGFMKNFLTGAGVGGALNIAVSSSMGNPISPLDVGIAMASGGVAGGVMKASLYSAAGANPDMVGRVLTQAYSTGIGQAMTRAMWNMAGY